MLAEKEAEHQGEVAVLLVVDAGGRGREQVEGGWGMALARRAYDELLVPAFGAFPDELEPFEAWHQALLFASTSASGPPELLLHILVVLRVPTQCPAIAQEPAMLSLPWVEAPSLGASAGGQPMLSNHRRHRHRHHALVD